jgi:hypothetical protein
MLIPQHVAMTRNATVLAAFLAASGCGGEPTQPEPEPEPSCGVPTVAVSGLPEAMVAFQAAQMTASIQPALCAGESVTWSTTGGVTVNAAGLVTATHVGGPFTVTATVKGVQASQTTTVAMAPVVPDTRWALAWADSPAAADYALSAFYSSSTGGAIRSTRSGPGSYAVRFPGLATGAGQREVVQVSAYGNVPRRCRVLSWGNDGADLVVQVRCHDLAGTPTDAYFTILVAPAGSTQGRSAFVVTPSVQGTGPIAAATSHNSSQGDVTVTRTELGRYRVTFAGLARPAATDRETFHVTAYGDGTTWCKISIWGDSGTGSALTVDCYDVTGARADARFSVLMLDRARPGRRLGYVWSSALASAVYTPSTIYAFNSGGAVNAGTWMSDGVYEIGWTGLARVAGSAAETNLVTAYGNDATYCQVGDWSSASTRFRCFAPDGTATNSLFVGLWIE